MRKISEDPIFEPAPQEPLLAVLEGLEALDECFPPIRDDPPDPVDL